MVALEVLVLVEVVAAAAQEVDPVEAVVVDLDPVVVVEMDLDPVLLIKQIALIWLVPINRKI